MALRTPFIKSRVMQIKVRHLLYAPPPPPSHPALASSLVYSSSLHVRLSLEMEDVHSKHHCSEGSLNCRFRKFVITHKSDLLMQMKRYMTVNVYSSFRPALSRKQKGRLLRS